MSEKSITAQEVLQWMLDNKDNYEAMDNINRVSFAYMKGIRAHGY